MSCSTISLFLVCAQIVCSISVNGSSEKLSTEQYVNLITNAIERVWKDSVAIENNRTMGNVAIPGLILTGPTILDRGALGIFGVPVVHLTDDGSVEIKAHAGLENQTVKYTYILDGGASGDFFVMNGYRKYKMFFKSDDGCADFRLISMILFEEDPIVVEAHGPSSVEALKLSKVVNHWLTLQSRASAYYSISDSLARISFHKLNDCTS